MFRDISKHDDDDDNNDDDQFLEKADDNVICRHFVTAPQLRLTQ
jgi:hypothetical protein